MTEHPRHDQFIEYADLHNRLRVAADNPHLFTNTQTAFIEDMSQRHWIGEALIDPTPLEATYLTPHEADCMDAICLQLILNDIEWKPDAT